MNDLDEEKHLISHWVEHGKEHAAEEVMVVQSGRPCLLLLPRDDSLCASAEDELMGWHNQSGKDEYVMQGSMALFADHARDLKLTINEYTKSFILRYQDQYSEQELANMLGITRKSLWERRKKWGMPKKWGKSEGRRVSS